VLSICILPDAHLHELKRISDDAKRRGTGYSAESRDYGARRSNSMEEIQSSEMRKDGVWLLCSSGFFDLTVIDVALARSTRTTNFALSYLVAPT